MNLIVYTKPDCVQCDYTKRELAKTGVTYTEIDLREPLPGSTTMGEWLRETHGFTAAPIVHNVVTDEWWCGFRIEKLRGLRGSKVQS